MSSGDLIGSLIAAAVPIGGFFLWLLKKIADEVIRRGLDLMRLIEKLRIDVEDLKRDMQKTRGESADQRGAVREQAVQVSHLNAQVSTLVPRMNAFEKAMDRLSGHLLSVMKLQTEIGKLSQYWKDKNPGGKK